MVAKISFVMVASWIAALMVLLSTSSRAERLSGVDLQSNGQTVVQMSVVPGTTSILFNGVGLPDQILTRVEYLSYRTTLQPLRMLAASFAVECVPGGNPCGMCAREPHDHSLCVCARARDPSSVPNPLGVCGCTEPMACLCPNHHLVTDTEICSCLSVLYDPTMANNQVNCYLGTYSPASTTLTAVTPCVTGLSGPAVTTIPQTANIEFTAYWDTWSPDASMPPQYYPAKMHYRPPNGIPGAELTFTPAAAALFPSPNNQDFGWSSLLVMHQQMATLQIDYLY